MRLSRTLAGIALLALPFLAGPALATSLQAMPVLLEMPAGAGASSVTVRNVGKKTFDVQTRIFRWTQNGAEDVLEETSDVVTSPPITSLDPGKSYAVRVVKLDGKPVPKEHAYRLLVDQLPDEDQMRSGTVALVMRHSIPVFSTPERASGPNIRWSVSSANGRLVLIGRNDGERRVRLSNVSVALGGSNVKMSNGLMGYVLAGSTMRWVGPPGSGASVAGKSPRVIATTDAGALDAPATLGR